MATLLEIYVQQKNKCHLISIIGNDDDGKKIKKKIKEIKNLTFNIFVDKNRSTTKKTRYVSENQQILRVDKETHDPISKNLVDSIIKSLEKKIRNCYNVVILL